MSYLTPLIIVLIFLNAIILSKFEKSKSSFNKRIDSELVLRVPKAYKYLAYGLMIVGLLFILIGLFKFGFNSNVLIITFSMFLFTVLVGLFTLLYQRNHRLTFTNNHIVIFNFLNKSKTLNWSDIKSIKLNLFLSMYSIKTKTRTIKINQHLIGLNALFDYAEKKGIET